MTTATENTIYMRTYVIATFKRRNRAEVLYIYIYISVTMTYTTH